MSESELRVKTTRLHLFSVAAENRQSWRKTALCSCLQLFALSLGIFLLMAIFIIPFAFYRQVNTSSPFKKIEVNRSMLNGSHCTLYNDGQCHQVLENFLSFCAIENQTKHVFITSPNESDIQNASSLLKQYNVSETCQSELLSFLCLHLLGLCDSTGSLVQPTADQCRDIRDEICFTEWDILSAAGVDFPKCSNFPNSSCLSKKPDIICSKNFVFDEEFQICAPSCQHWSLYEEVTTKVLQIITATSYSLGILIVLSILIVSIRRYKAMFQIPTFFLIYICIDFLIIDLTAVIGSNNSNLFCTAPSWFRTTTSPFCIISGMVYVYCLPQTGLWMLFHSIYFFWSTWFPFSFDKHKAKGNLRKLHFCLTLAGIVFPLYGIVITITENDFMTPFVNNSTDQTSSLGFATIGNPPRLCAPGSISSFFFGVVIPIDVTLAAGGTLIILVIYRLSKNKKLSGAVEVKLILVLIHFLIVNIVTVVTFSLSFRYIEALNNSIRIYFECESQGHNPLKPCPKDYQNYSSPIFSAVTNILVAFATVFVLVYAINFRELKKNCMKQVHHK